MKCGKKIVYLGVRKTGYQLTFVTCKLCDFGEVIESCFISISFWSLSPVNGEIVHGRHLQEMVHGRQPPLRRSSVDSGSFPVPSPSLLQDSFTVSKIILTLHILSPWPRVRFLIVEKQRKLPNIWSQKTWDWVLPLNPGLTTHPF